MEPLWLAEGSEIHDIDRIDLIRRSEQLEELKKDNYIDSYEKDLKTKLCKLTELFDEKILLKTDHEL